VVDSLLKLGLNVLWYEKTTCQDYINHVLIKLNLLWINTFACLKMNQYLTGLTVSYSRKNPIAQKLIAMLSFIMLCVSV